MNSGTQVAGLVLIALLTIILIAMLMAIPTLLLWNWLMPVIFGLKEITLWQALGLNILSGILFKSSNLAGSKS